MLCVEDNSCDYFDLPSKWMYRGEGNCNVVISLPDVQKIIRIRKTDRPKSILGWILILISDLLYWYCGKGFKDEIRDLKFYSLIMRPLISYDYTSEADQVLLSRKQVKMLQCDLSRYRPEFRKHKCLQYGRAAMFDDFTYLNTEGYNLKFSESTYTIEIKPKQGWTPLSEKVGNKCTFCVNQFRKKEKNEISNITRYCPEDLFSGKEENMKYAIKCLLEDPQNNLKIFRCGNLLYGEKVKKNLEGIFADIFDDSTKTFENLQTEFCSLIQKCLVTSLTEEPVDKFSKHVCTSEETINEHNLPKGCVLEKILSVQMLDKYGSEFHSKLLNSDIIDGWAYVSKLVNTVETNSDMCLKCTLMSYTNRKGEDFDPDLAAAPYLLSAVAKDCSLMITFRKILGEVGNDINSKSIFKTKYGYYLANVGVFDLYPKPLSTIRKHVKRNKESYEAYKRATKEE